MKKKITKYFFKNILPQIIVGVSVGLTLFTVQFLFETKDNKINIAISSARSDFDEITRIANQRLFAVKMLTENYSEYKFNMNAIDSAAYFGRQQLYRGKYIMAVEGWNIALGKHPKVLKHSFGIEFKELHERIRKQFGNVHDRIKFCKGIKPYDTVCFQRIIEEDIKLLSNENGKGTIDSLYNNMYLAIVNKSLKY